MGRVGEAAEWRRKPVFMDISAINQIEIAKFDIVGQDGNVKDL
jgi:hypothetical protein